MRQCPFPVKNPSKRLQYRMGCTIVDLSRIADSFYNSTENCKSRHRYLHLDWNIAMNQDEPIAHKRCVAVDVETTGLSASRGDRIIEVGAVALIENGAGDEFHTLIDPGVPVSIPAQRVHGITNEMLRGMPKPEDALTDFHRFIGDSVLVAHNVSFDVTFLRYEFSRLGLGFNNLYRCTLTMSRRRYPTLRDHKLETVCRHLFGALPEGARMHRALDDARMAARVWIEMTKQKPV